MVLPINHNWKNRLPWCILETYLFSLTKLHFALLFAIMRPFGLGRYGLIDENQPGGGRDASAKAGSTLLVKFVESYISPCLILFYIENRIIHYVLHITLLSYMVVWWYEHLKWWHAISLKLKNTLTRCNAIYIYIYILNMVICLGHLWFYNFV